MIRTLKHLPNRILVPDLLGYGNSSNPTDPQEYIWTEMVQDLIDIRKTEKIENVIPVGHDWGSLLAQRFYNIHPELCAGLVLLAVAYRPPNKEAPFDLPAVNAMSERRFGYATFEYWNLFTSPEAPDLFIANVDRVFEVMHWADPGGMKKMFCIKDAMRDYLTDHSIPNHELKEYAQDPKLREDWQSNMRASGFQAPFCWHKALVFGFQHEVEKQILDENIPVRVPVLYIGYTQDAVCRPELIKHREDAGLIPDLRVEVIESGHWGPLEKLDGSAMAIKQFIEEKRL